MKRLYLVRHAKSSWKEEGLTDFDRPLNKRGKRNAPVMGQRLKARNVRPDLILSSPAKRALKTARLIAEEIGYPKKRIAEEMAIYGAGRSTLLQVVQEIDDAHGEAMMVGHNPGFTELAEYLSGERIDNMPTCGVFCVDFEVDSWRDVAGGGGKAVFFDYPKLDP